MTTSAWNLSFLDCPFDVKGNSDANVGPPRSVCIAHVEQPLSEILPEDCWIWEDSPQVAIRTALSDYVARKLSSKNLPFSGNLNGFVFQLQTLESAKAAPGRAKRQMRPIHHAFANNLPPLMLERTDVWSRGSVLHIFLLVLAYDDPESDVDRVAPSLHNEAFCNSMKSVVKTVIQKVLLTTEETERSSLRNHLATAVLQDRLRSQLHSLGAVAFVANNSILPRKSGASSSPMASPPAIPFEAPNDSPMNRTIEVPLGRWYSFLTQPPTGVVSSPNVNGCSALSTPSMAVLTGLLVPRGVSLIVGGGYHGKSTLLRTIAAGVYNKVPGDGREYCVTVDSAVTVRAEDGRYVNNCNVSAFISNLPSSTIDTVDEIDKSCATRATTAMSASSSTLHFSSGEASGSTSQAANVSEAIEMGATAFLVDEDVSAANFMARDGRMRSLVMDESITPLLYRVNGLYDELGISSIVVVGGVGDWLDVPNHVVLMDKYRCRDATQKARSISRQFSHGHVQYGGRGVVHRLPWHQSGSSVRDPNQVTRHTPIPRRPSDLFSKRLPLCSTVISLLDGNDAIAFHKIEVEDDTSDHMDADCNDEGEDVNIVDMSRCEQLLGKKPQLYGCGICILWLMEVAQANPNLGLPDLLSKLDKAMDAEGLASLVGDIATWSWLLESQGFAYRPRRFEVGQALTRLRGIQLEEIPIPDDESLAAAKEEAERKKQALLEMWNSRRKSKQVEFSST